MQPAISSVLNGICFPIFIPKQFPTKENIKLHSPMHNIAKTKRDAVSDTNNKPIANASILVAIAKTINLPHPNAISLHSSSFEFKPYMIILPPKKINIKSAIQ